MFRGLTYLNTVIASAQFVHSITAHSITETYTGPSASIKGLIHVTMHCDTFHETFFCGAHTLITCSRVNFYVRMIFRPWCLANTCIEAVLNTGIWNFIDPSQSAWYFYRHVYQRAWGPGNFETLLFYSGFWCAACVRAMWFSRVANYSVLVVIF
jgi:hypothetical protein